VRVEQDDRESRDRREQQRAGHEQARRRVRERALDPTDGPSCRRHSSNRCSSHGLRVPAQHEEEVSVDLPQLASHQTLSSDSVRFHLRTLSWKTCRRVRESPRDAGALP
jgi:hypothetical protein